MHPGTDAKGDRIGEHWVPVEIDSLLQSDAPSFPLHQHRFAREMHHLFRYYAAAAMTSWIRIN